MTVMLPPDSSEHMYWRNDLIIPSVCFDPLNVSDMLQIYLQILLNRKSYLRIRLVFMQMNRKIVQN